MSTKYNAKSLSGGTVKSAYGSYLLALLLFGTNGIVASQIPLASYEIVFLRTGIGSALLLGFFFLSRQPKNCLKNKTHLLLLTASGMALGASWIFLFEAYQAIGVGVASLLYYCGPVIVVALSPLLFQERLTKWKIGSFGVVLCGLCLINAQMPGGQGSKWGLFCGGMAALLYAVMVICNKKASSIQGLENSALQLFASFLTVAVYLLFKGGMTTAIPGSAWLPILLLGALNTGVGCYLYFSSIGRLPVQTVSVCGYLEPLAAVLFSALLLKEQLLPIQLLGAACILGGALLGECKLPQRTPKKQGYSVAK